MNAPGQFLQNYVRRLGIEPHERGLLVLMGALVGVLFGAYTIAKVLRDALFLAEFGALKLPYAYLGVALASGGTVWMEGRVARRVPRFGAIHFTQYTAITLSALAASVYPMWRHGTTAFFYLWTGSQAMMLLPHFWSLALDVWDSRRARSLFPLLTGCGLLGGLAGGALAGWGTHVIQRVGLMWVLSGLLVGVHVLTRMVERHQIRRPGPVDLKQSVSRWALLRRSSYLQLLAAGLALSVVVSTLVDFQFKYFIQQAYPDPHALTAFLGKFYAGLNGLALVFQFTAAGWLLHRFGLGPAIGLQPLTAMLFTAWTAISAGWWPVVVLRWIQGIVFQALGKSSAEIYYTAVPSYERRFIKPAIDTLVDRWADALAGVLLIVILHLFRVPMGIIALVTGVLGIVWFAFILLLNRQYGRTFEKIMSRRWNELEEVAESLRLPSARRALYESLASGDERRILLALELCQIAKDPRQAKAVRSCLDHPSPAIRAAALRAMQAMRLRGADKEIEVFLHEPNEGLRRAAVDYLIARGPRPGEFVRRLLDGDDPLLQQYVLDALFDRPQDAQGTLTSEWVLARLESGTEPDLLLAARALGVLTERTPLEWFRTLLTHADVEVQRAALISATRRPRRELLDVLEKLLLESSLSYEARQALAALGDLAVVRLQVHLSGEKGPRAQALAARTLAEIGTPRAARALMSLVRNRDSRLRHVGLQSLVRLRERIGHAALSQSLSHKLFFRELADYRRFREPAERIEASPVPEVRLLADSFQESAVMALERALWALASWYPSRPLVGTLDHLRSRDPERVAPGLEYLGHLLPRPIFREVTKIFENKPKEVSPAPDEKEALAETIRLAWRLGDEWMRACAVRASRYAPQVDRQLFDGDDGQEPLVRAELEALMGSPSPAGSGAC